MISRLFYGWWFFADVVLYRTERAILSRINEERQFSSAVTKNCRKGCPERLHLGMLGIFLEHDHVKLVQWPILKLFNEARNRTTSQQKYTSTSEYDENLRESLRVFSKRRRMRRRKIRREGLVNSVKDCVKDSVNMKVSVEPVNGSDG
jgi:hypothetical protein